MAEISDRYDRLASAQALLMAIANVHAGSIEVPRQAAADIVALVIGTDGRIQVQPGPLFEVISGVEANRIRQCSECKRIFWAGRIDKFACTSKCVLRRRVRLWREHYIKSYKLQRVRKVEAAECAKVNSNAKSRRKTQ
jgi:hypothetical protein